MNTELVVFDNNDAIQAQGVLNPLYRDTLFVYWDILKAFDPSVNVRDSDCCVFVKDHLFKTARKIIAQNRPFYCITISGAEPTRHPLLPDLVAYLFSLTRKLAITITTDGSPKTSYFETLFKNAPKYGLHLDITLDQNSDLHHLNELLSLAMQYRQAVHLICTDDFASYDTLVQLRKTIPFTITTSKDSSSFQKLFLEAQEACPADPSALPCPEWFESTNYEEPVVVEKDQQEMVCQNFFCCLGHNFFYIAPNGQFSSACNGLAPLRNIPFWEAGPKTLKKLQKIVQCSDTSMLRGPNLVIPKFRTMELAEAWVQEQTSSSRIWKKNELCISTKEDLIRGKMRRLSLLQTVKEKQNPQPDWLEDSVKDICTLYDLLADTSSRDILVRAMKSLETGDPGYLPSCSQETAHPAYPGEVIISTTSAEVLKQSLAPDGRLISLQDLQTGIDDFLATTGEICSAIYLNLNDSDFSVLKSASKTISTYQPRLRLSTPILQHTLTVPLWLHEYCPTAPLTLQVDPQGICICADPIDPPARYLPKANVPLPLVSVVIPYHFNDDGLRHCVQSILSQERNDIEVLLIGNDGMNSVDDCVAEFVKEFPNCVRSICLDSEENTLPDALNAGLDMALGAYITFVNPHEMVSWQFLEKGLECIRAEHPDIIAFDRVLIHSGSYEHFGMEASTSSGMQSLEDFLADRIGPTQVSGRIFNVERLRLCKIRFQAFGSDTELAFGIQAHLHSRKTIVLPDIACFEEKTEGETFSDDHALQGFGGFVAWYSRFCQTYGLNHEQEREILERAYISRRGQLFSFLNTTDFENDGESSISDTLIEQLTSSKDLFCSIIKDFALLYCQREGLQPSVGPDDHPWSNDSTCSVYTESQCSNPAITAILLASFDGDVTRTIESIQDQDLKDYELIIIDDGGKPDRYDLLQVYAEVNSRISLIQSTNIKCAIERVHGRYLVFVQQGDICLPTYFSQAVSSMEECEADIICFSTEDIDADNTSLRTQEYQNEVFSEERIPDATDQFSLTIYGKVFERSFLDIYQLSLAEDSESFVRTAIENASMIVTDSFLGYKHLEQEKTEEQFVRSSHLHSLYYTLKAPSDQMNEEENKLSIFLQHIAAFWQQDQSIPMTDREYEVLSSKKDLVRYIFTEYGRLLEESDEEKNMLPEISMHETYEFDAANAVEPYISIFNNDFMPSHEEIKVLQTKPLLFKMFLTDYATKYCEEYRQVEIPSQEDILPTAPIIKPSEYLIPVNNNLLNTSNTNTKLALSIIVVAKNSSESIIRCLDSIIQEKVQEFEVILIDDSSDSDDTLLLCQKYHNKDTRIRFFRTPLSTGVGQCRNLGIAQASGEWLLFLDPRDWLCKGFLSKAMTFISNNTTAEVIDFSWQAYSEDKSQVLYMKTMPVEKHSSSRTGRPSTMQSLFSKWFPGKKENYGLWSKLIKRNIIEDNNIRYLPHRISDDLYFLIQLAINVKKSVSCQFFSVYHILEEDERYGYNEGLYSFGKQQIKEIIDSISAIHKYLLDMGVNADSEEYKKVFTEYWDDSMIDKIMMYVYINNKIGYNSDKNMMFPCIMIEKWMDKYKMMNENEFADKDE